MPPLVKICGIKDAAGLDAAVGAGADMVGFVFFAKSPRHLSFEQAGALASRVGVRARRVALSVDADDALLDAIVAACRPDVLQLHGSEPPARVAHVRRRYGRAVMRALSIGTRADLATIPPHDAVADLLLFDAKTPNGSDRPGGNGTAFDWALLKGVETRVPWLLAGGLDAGNVATALAATRAHGLDVSSGVESAPGVKDATRIKAFVAAARAARAAVATEPMMAAVP